MKIQKAKIQEKNELLIENNQNLTDQIKSGNGRVKSKSNNNLKLANDRKKLTNHYMNQYNGGLDLNFFEEWGIIPCLLKGTTIFNKGSIDIISKSNEEFNRGHVKRKLSNGEIIKAQFHISKYDNNGIWISGIGLNKTKLLKFDRYSRAVPQQAKQQIKSTPPQRARVSIKSSKMK